MASRYTVIRASLGARFQGALDAISRAREEGLGCKRFIPAADWVVRGSATGAADPIIHCEAWGCCGGLIAAARDLPEDLVRWQGIR